MKKVTSLILLMLMLSLCWTAQAQVSTYSFASSLGTYTEVTGGTVQGITGAWDDAQISNVALGFTFNYNGTDYTTVSINPNGYLIIGGGTTTMGYVPISSTVVAAGSVGAVGRDLQGIAVTGEISSLLSGTAGDYVFTVQWKNAKRYGTSYADEILNFQIKLYENGGNIEIVYGPITGSAYATPLHPQVGIRGATNADYKNRTTTTDWGATTAGIINTATCTLTNLVFPASGQTFTFSPPAAGTPDPPTNPVPANAATAVPLNGDVTWTFGANTATYDLMFGPTGSMTQVVTGATAAATGSYAYSGLNASGTYQWQVIEHNGALTTTGPVWGFATVCGDFSIPFTESFDTYTPPAVGCGTIVNANGDAVTWASSTTTPYTAPNSLRIGYSAAGVTQDDWYFTPGLLLDAGVSYDVTFYYRGGSSSYVESLEVLWGDAPTVAGMTNGPIFSDVDFYVATYTEVKESFTPATTGTYYLGWHCFSIPDQLNINVDEISVVVTPDCPAPTLLMANNITPNSADLSWTPGGDELLWDLVYGAPGFDPDLATPITGIDAIPYTLEMLTPATSYEYYVRSDCGADETSLWSSVKGFTTSCIEVTEFTEGFDAVTVPAFPTCWAKVSTTGSSNTQTTNPFSAPNCLYIYSSGTSEAVVSMPPLSNAGAGTHILKFKARGNFTAGGMLYIGYLTDPTDAATFVSVTSVTVGSLVYEDYTANLGMAPAGYNTLAIKASGTPAYSMLIDDVSWEEFTAGTLEGTVTELGVGPMENARVFSGTYEAFTNAAGFYSIPNILPDTYTFSCEAVGFTTVTVDDVVIIGGETTTLDFEMGAPEIAVDPASLEETLAPGETSVQTLTISNTGTAPLTWSASLESVDPPPSFNGYLEFINPQPNNNSNPELDASPYTYEAKGETTDATWDVLYNWTTNAGAQVGLETDGQFYYTSTWNLSGTFSKYEMDGTFVETFTIATVGGVRDLAYDGQYFYGGASAATIYVLDLANQALVSTITCASPVTVRHIAYDDATDAFWTGNWTQLYLINRSGAILQTGPVVASIYGSAYDPYTAGGPFVWLFSQTDCSGTTFDLVQIQQFDIAANALTGVTHCATDIPGYIPGVSGATTIAGGMCTSTQIVPGKFVMAVNVQQDPNLVGVYELAELQSWISLDTYGGVIEAGLSETVNVNYDATGLVDSTYLANINITHNGQDPLDATLTVPVTLTVASPDPPTAPSDPSPAHLATLVPLQPVFSWTNGVGTAQSRIQLVRGSGGFGVTVYTSPYNVGYNSFDLASVGITLLSKGNYSWRVTCKNSAGETNGPWWNFQTIGQGTIAGTVTDAYSGDPIDGITITAEELRYETTTGPDGTYSIPAVLEGTYLVTAEKNGYVSQTQEAIVPNNQTVTVDFALDKVLYPPFGLKAEIQNFYDVHLTWSAPGSGFEPEWLTYSADAVSNSIGTNAAATFDVAARYEPDQLTGFPGGAITKIQFVPGEPGTTCVYTLKIWEGVSPPTLIYEQQLATVVSDVWNEVILDTPVPFDNTQELWFGFGVNTTTGYPAGCDAGPQVEGFSNMMFWNGAWTTLTALNAALTYNWAVKAYVEAGADGIMLDPVAGNHVAHNNAGTLSSRPNKIEPAAISVTENSSRALLGYNVFKDDVQINPAMVVVTEFDDPGLLAGDYAYTVTAIYDEGESVPVGPVIASIMAPPTLTVAEQVVTEIYLEWESNFVGKSATSVEDSKALTTNLIGTAMVKKTSTGKPYQAPLNPKQGGDNIATAMPIAALPFTETGTTDGYLDDYDEICPYDSPGAPDVVYSYTPAADMFIDVYLCESLYDTKLYIYENDETTSIACNDDECGDDTYKSQVLGVPLYTGNVYYIVVDGFDAASFGEYVLTVEEYIPPLCEVECPAGATPEGEACLVDGDTDITNGGCNSDPNAFGSISNGETICGTSSTYIDAELVASRDTDWFEFVLAEPASANITAMAEFPLQILIVDGNFGCEGSYVMYSGVAAPCEELMLEDLILPPGTFYLWVGPQSGASIPCSVGDNIYYVTLDYEDIWLNYFNVWRTDSKDLLATTYYSWLLDETVAIGDSKCYTVSEVVAEGIETGMSNELCVDVLCPAPYAMLSSDITDVSASLSWMPGNMEEEWDILWGEAGFDPMTEGTLVEGITASPYLLEGLMAATEYDWYVRSVCDPDNIGLWAGPATFATIVCQPEDKCDYTLNFTDSFGDGWNDAAVEIYQAGIFVGSYTLAAGFSGSAIVPLCDMTFTELYWVSGAWDSECGFSLVGPDGSTLTSFVAGGAPVGGAMFFSFTSECPACAIPTALYAGGLTGSSADLFWTAGGAEMEWNILWGEADFDPETEGTLVEGVMAIPYLLEGLMEMSGYDFYVQAVCGEGVFSEFAGPASFMTPCPALALPLYEDFESGTFPPVCWSSYDLDAAGTQWASSITYNHTPGGTTSAKHGYSTLPASGQDGWLVTPALELPDESINLTFWSYNTFPTWYVKNSVLISTGSPDPLDGEFIEVWTTDAVTSAWVESVVSLNDYSGQNVYIAFRYEGYDGHDWYLDDVMVDVYVPPMQDIVIPMGWSAWSSYMDPMTDAMFADVIAPVLDDMIISQYFSELFYPEYGINSMGDFSTAHGYVSKMLQEATLTIAGEMADPTIALNMGWNLIPVISDCDVDITELGLVPGFVIAWDIAGGGIYYPLYGINTIGYMVPGAAYYVKMDAAGSFTFPDCAPLDNASANKPYRVENTTNWNAVNYTGVSHAVIFDEIAAAKLVTGDMIGAFTADGTCAGIAEVTGGSIGLKVFADDITTLSADGFVEGETLSYKVFRQATGEEFILAVTYDVSAPNANGLFATNGLSVVSDLTMSVTGINVQVLNGLSVYPNPSTGIFNVSVTNLDQDIDYVIVNAKGQAVLEAKLLETQEIDLSFAPKGIYFIKFMNNEVLRIEKVVIR